MGKIYIDNNITIIRVEKEREGARVAFGLLERIVDKKSLLFLSGGSSPRYLYRLIGQAATARIRPGAVATVDERWGPPGHPNSNEQMMRELGLYAYFQKIGVEVQTILHGILNRHETAQRYNTVLEGLLERFKKRVAIVGIGADGHTAGLAPGIDVEQTTALAVDFVHHAPNWHYPERITITPRTLRQITTHIILAFGAKKTPILNTLLDKEKTVGLKEFPAGIYRKINGKVYLVTDTNGVFGSSVCA